MERSHVMIYAAILLLATSLAFADLSQPSGANPVSGHGGTSTVTSALATDAVTPPVFRDVDEGVVVGMSTWDTNTTRPLLKTNYFHGSAGTWGKVQYVWPKLTGFVSNDPYESRACFDMKYYDAQKKEIPEIANSMCVGAYDSGFVLEVLKVSPASSNQGRALVTAPLVS